jgi:hypothetical protein
MGKLCAKERGLVTMKATKRAETVQARRPHVLLLEDEFTPGKRPADGSRQGKLPLAAAASSGFSRRWDYAISAQPFPNYTTLRIDTYGQSVHKETIA